MTDWDMKRQQRLIVMSAKYRRATPVGQVSCVSHDPENRCLTVMPIPDLLIATELL